MKYNALNFTALAIAASVVLCSCSSESKPQDHYDNEIASIIEAENSETAETDAVQLKCAYNVTEADFPEGAYYVDGAYSINNSSEIMLICGGFNNNSSLYITDKTFSDYRAVVLEEPVEISQHRDRYIDYFPQSDGSITTYTHTEEREGMSIPTNEDEAMNFDWETYNSIEPVCADFISFYDKTGKLTSFAQISEEGSHDDLQCLFGDSEILIKVYSDGAIVRINSDGSSVELKAADDSTLSSDQYNYQQIRKISSGEWIFINTVESSSDGSWTRSSEACVFDPDTGKMDPPFFKSDGSDYDVSTYLGQDYPVMVDDWRSLYGVDLSGNKEEIISWENSDISSVSLVSIGNNEFIGWQYNGETGSLLYLTPKDPSDLSDVNTLTINTLYTDIDSDLINKFNRSQNKYRVVRADSDEYGNKNFDSPEEFDEYFNNRQKQFNLDLIAGNAPDIIAGLPYDSMVNLSKKGVFADLYELMDNDSQMDRDAFLPNLLHALESPDKKLFTLPADLSLNTIFAKTSICDKGNWTMDDMIALFDNAPASAKHLYDGENKLEMFNIMSDTLCDAVDYNNGKCNFDTPDTVKLLEFCNRFVDDVPMPDKEADGWDAHQSYYADRAEWWGRNEKLIEMGDLSMPAYYSDNKYYFSDGSDVTFVGYPSNDGCGGRFELRSLMSVSSGCKDKEGAWEFIKFYLNNCDSTFSPISKKCDDMLYNAMNGKNTAQGREMPNIKNEDRLQISAYLNSCSKIGNTFGSSISSICEEEAQRYFNGEISADEAAKTMQSRVSILVSEQS